MFLRGGGGLSPTQLQPTVASDECEEEPFPMVPVSSRLHSWLDRWSTETTDTMGVYIVSVIDDGGQASRSGFGLLCSYRPQFGYQLHVRDAAETVRVRMDYHYPIPWSNDIEHAVRAYSGPAGPAAGVVALLWPECGGLALDLEAMCSNHPKPPSWVWCLHEQVQRLLILERASALLAPVAPMPSPLALRAALGPDNDALRMLGVVGRDVLRFVAIVAEATRQPHGHAQALEARAAGLTGRSSLASMVARSHILGFVETPDTNVDAKELAADVGEALFGSVFLEQGGTFANVVGFWRWLAAEDGINGPRALDHLGLALRHLGGQLRYYYIGRTPTYSKIREVSRCDGGCQPPSLALEVTYDLPTTGHVILTYQMVNARAQELQVGVNGTEPRWVEFSRALGSLVSPALGKPLPCKVSAWICSKPLAPLLKFMPPAEQAVGIPVSAGAQQWRPCGQVRGARVCGVCALVGRSHWSREACRGRGSF